MSEHPSACAIEWVVIPAPDLARAKAFYAGVFHFEISEYSNSFAIFRAGNLSGGLDSQLIPSRNGAILSFTVASIPEALAAIEAHGGRAVRQAYALGEGVGFCAQFEDPNGNAFELYSAIPPTQTG